MLSITACYAFVMIDATDLEDLRNELMAFGKQRNMQGLVLIAPEGINAMVAGSVDAIAEWKNLLCAKFGKIKFKDSQSDRGVFRRWSVKIKPEIVAIKDEDIQPRGNHKHLSPQAWQDMLEREDVVLVDARNAYEVAIGKFKNAVDPGINMFHEFPAFVKQGTLPKDKKVLLYCTGGIRCEKAIIAMEKEGYDNVYQLEGGILAYLEQFPDSHYEGECFVFDHRAAVDQHLRPSQIYALCPHCGDPGDLLIHCSCGKEQKICASCSRESSRQTCSKRCRNEQRAMATVQSV